MSNRAERGFSPGGIHAILRPYLEKCMSALQASVHSVVPRMCQRVPERGSVISILFAAIPLSSGELDAHGGEKKCCLGQRRVSSSRRHM